MRHVLELGASLLYGVSGNTGSVRSVVYSCPLFFFQARNRRYPPGGSDVCMSVVRNQEQREGQKASRGSGNATDTRVAEVREVPSLAFLVCLC